MTGAIKTPDLLQSSRVAEHPDVFDFELGNAHCSVHVSKDQMKGFAEVLHTFTQSKRVALISDEAAFSHHGIALLKDLEASDFSVAHRQFRLANHEKNLATVNTIYDFLSEVGADSSTPVLILGGQVLIDCAGFAATTFFRGLPLVFIPTTLLAQVDGAMSGNLGVHYGGMTNHVGSRRLPLFVWSCLETLQTLPDRVLRAGTAEVIKQSVVADSALFDYLEGSKAALNDPIHLEYIERETLQTKARLMKAGRDIATNYGHTFGHALEGTLNHRRLLHGEAVSVGMIFANRLAVAMGHMTQEEALRVEQLLTRTGLPTRPPTFSDLEFPEASAYSDRLLKGMSRDKKLLHGEVQWVIPTGIGEFSTRSVPEDLLRDTLANFIEDTQIISL
jgi:3-dehydroquinate synthetase